MAESVIGVRSLVLLLFVSEWVGWGRGSEGAMGVRVFCFKCRFPISAHKQRC